MVSIYQKVLGESYQKLHPKLQHRYDITEHRGFKAKGKMNRLTGGKFWVRQWFRLGIPFKLLFPERGNDVPFYIHNFAARSKDGRTYVKWNRTFMFGDRERHFNATMYLDAGEKEIIDSFGEPHVLVSTLSFAVDSEGSMHISSQKQRLRLFGIAVPLPKFLYGHAKIIESYDDHNNCFCVKVDVRNALLGTLFLYEGTFNEKASGHDETDAF